MKKVLVGLVAIGGMSAVTAAEEMPVSIEFLLGQTSQQPIYLNSGTPKESDISLGFRFGYDLSDTWALELAYRNHGEVDGKFIDSYGDTITDTTKSSEYNVGFKKAFILSDKVSINGRFGLAFWDWDFKETDSSSPGVTNKWTDSGNDIYLGIGLNYLIEDNFFMSLDYSYTSMDITVTSSSGSRTNLDNDVDTISIGAGYKF